MASPNSNVTADPAKAVLYARFSDRRNSEDCESIDVQEKYCFDYCEERGYEVEAEFCDQARSGKDEERPGLWDAISMLKHGWILVVHREDRLARSVYLSEVIRREVLKRGARIEAVSGGRNGDSPEDVFIRQVLAAYAEMERKVTAARTSAAMRRYMADGRAMGGVPPFGKRFGSDQTITLSDGTEKTFRTWVDDPDEQKAIERIRELRSNRLGYRAVARQLNEEGVSCRGRQWYHGRVKEIEGRTVA